MANNPFNLAVRFVLELGALVAFGLWGWSRGEGFLRVLWAILPPLLAAAAWGIFRVPNDPGRAPVPVPGILRLVLEAAFFGLATWALAVSVSTTWAWIFAAVVLVHYALSYDRVLSLLKR